MHDREHVISVVLSTEDWKALLEVQPDAVNWIKQRIQERIGEDRRKVRTARASVDVATC
jgi:hypothetical protein